MKIAIIGAGVGGILCLQSLKRKLPKAEFVLIDDSELFVFTPRLTEILSDKGMEKYTVRPMEVFKDKHVKVVLARAEKIDLKKQEISLSNKKKITYDAVICAQGAKTNFFGLKNAKKFCLQYKDYRDVDALRKEILMHLKKEGKVKIGIVGGGPTGVELAFAIKELAKNQNFTYDQTSVTIYQGGDTLVEGFHPKIVKRAHKECNKIGIIVKTNHHVNNITKNKLFFDKGKAEEADILIWAAGVTPNVLDFSPSIELNKGAIPVSKTLQFKDYNNAFAIGDCNLSLNPSDKPYPPTAQIASEQANHVAKNVVAFFKKKSLKDFNYRIRGAFLLLGKQSCPTQVFFLVFDGFLGRFMRDQYYKHIVRKMLKQQGL